MDLLNTLKGLRRAISDDFYKKLLEGKISDAKNTLRFIRDSMQNIMTEWYLIRKNLGILNPEETKNLGDLILAFQNKIDKIDNLLIINLQSLTDKDFENEPELWRTLLAEEFGQIIDECLSIIKLIKEKLSIIESSKKKLFAPVHLPQYVKLKKNFSKDQIRTIDKTEEKIIYYLSQKIFVKKVTDKILTGPWAGHLHAWLTGTLGYYRIIYSLEGKTVTFETIGRKNDLGID